MSNWEVIRWGALTVEGTMMPMRIPLVPVDRPRTGRWRPVGVVILPRPTMGGSIPEEVVSTGSFDPRDGLVEDTGRVSPVRIESIAASVEVVRGMTGAFVSSAMVGGMIPRVVDGLDLIAA